MTSHTYPVAIRAILLVSVFSTPIANADIINGEDVKAKDPVRNSIAALYEPTPDGRGGSLCTASLIGPNTAVTAAHCVDPRGPKPVMIFGNNVRSSRAEKRPVTEVAINPRWRTRQARGMDQGDIAVVQFGGGTPEGYHPVPMLENDSTLKKGKAAVLAGYGISDARNKTGAGVLRKTRVRVENPRPGKSEMILDQSRGTGACHGDSGGPALVRQGARVVLAGVTNRSYPNSAPDDCRHKVVYTKVSSYRPWIEKTRTQFENDSPRGVAPDRGTPFHSQAAKEMRSIKSKVGRRLPMGARHLARLAKSSSPVTRPKRVRRSVRAGVHRPSRKSVRLSRGRNPAHGIRKHKKG